MIGTDASPAPGGGDGASFSASNSERQRLARTNSRTLHSIEALPDNECQIRLAGDIGTAAALAGTWRQSPLRQLEILDSRAAFA